MLLNMTWEYVRCKHLKEVVVTEKPTVKGKNTRPQMKRILRCDQAIVQSKTLTVLEGVPTSGSLGPVRVDETTIGLI